jgi:glycosyltransferase involved in cell wall biosynthesis
MHILLAPSSYAPRVGGLETAVAHLGAELSRRGHAVTVVTNQYPRTLAAYEYIEGLPVHRILMTNIMPGRDQLRRLPKYLLGLAIAPIQAARLACLVRSIRPTILNVHYLSTSALYVSLAGKLCSSHRQVISVHGSDLTTTPYPTGNPVLSRFVVNQSHAATACSQNQAGFLRQMMGAQWAEPLVVTGNGVEPDGLLDARRYQHPRPYLFAAARLIPKKGIDVLIRAMHQINTAGHDVDLIIAGGGPQEAALRSLTSQLGLERRIHFWGVARRPEIAALLQGCALFVLPSLWEAFGIAALEAMVCGKAVVASDCGGLPEVVRDGEYGLLVPPGDAFALSQAIITLLQDGERCALLGQRGSEIALSKYTWSAVTDRYLHSYALAQGNMRS